MFKQWIRLLLPGLKLLSRNWWFHWQSDRHLWIKRNHYHLLQWAYELWEKPSWCNDNTFKSRMWKGTWWPHTLYLLHFSTTMPVDGQIWWSAWIRSYCGTTSTCGGSNSDIHWLDLDLLSLEEERTNGYQLRTNQVSSQLHSNCGLPAAQLYECSLHYIYGCTVAVR